MFKELRKLYSTIEDHFHAGRFAEVDTLLRDADMESMESVLRIGLLRITYAARDKLVEWEGAVARAAAVYEAEGVDPQVKLFGLLK